MSDFKLTDEDLQEIRKNLENTTDERFVYKGFNVVRKSDGKSILSVNRHLDGTSEAEFGNIGDSEFFVNARKDIPKLLREVEELKNKLNRVTCSKEEEIGRLKFQLKRHIEVEESRREQFKKLHDLLEVYEIPKGGPTRYDSYVDYSPVTRFQLLIERVSDCMTIQQEDNAERRAKLLIVFNKLLKIIPLKYGELNETFYAYDKSNELLELEKEFKELGLATSENTTKRANHSVSVFSLFATITDIFCDKRLAFELDEDKNLKNVCYYFFNDKDEWVKDNPLNRIPSFISDHKFEGKK